MPDIDTSLDSRIKLALRVWAASQRREHALGPAAAAFQAAAPERIRGEERFQHALEDADTAESLQRAMAVHERQLTEWATKGVALLRAIEAADRGYDQELRDALDTYRRSISEGSDENDTNGIQTQ